MCHHAYLFYLSSGLKLSSWFLHSKYVPNWATPIFLTPPPYMSNLLEMLTYPLSSITIGKFYTWAMGRCLWIVSMRVSLLKFHSSYIFLETIFYYEDCLMILYVPHSSYTLVSSILQGKSHFNHCFIFDLGISVWTWAFVLTDRHSLPWCSDSRMRFLKRGFLKLCCWGIPLLCKPQIKEALCPGILEHIVCVVIYMFLNIYDKQKKVFYVDTLWLYVFTEYYFLYV